MMGMEFIHLIGSAGIVVKGVIFILISLSVGSWAIILSKLSQLRQAKKKSDAFLEFFWETKRLESVYDFAKNTEDSPVAEVFKAGYIELVNLKNVERKTSGDRLMDEEKTGPRIETGLSIDDLDNVERALRRTVVKESHRLESFVSFLATTASSAPFIGLFGTVWGIMSSFMSISSSKDTSLAVVAPGISEALIATAIGLFAAIPAAMFYNLFVSRVKSVNSDMNNFSYDFLNIVKRHFF